MILREHLRTIHAVMLRPDHISVEKTVGQFLLHALHPDATVRPDAALRRDAALRTGLGSETSGPEVLQISLHRPDPSAPAPAWAFRLYPNGGASLQATHGSLLFAVATLIVEDWGDRPADDFRAGAEGTVSFPWLRNLSDFLVGSLRADRHFERERYFSQLARQGFTHVTVNGLGVDRPFETSPPGDVYFWFYDYSPDLDQYVDSSLIRGYYPPDYLRANLAFLKDNVNLARKYGLTPGLHINSPRSMPEEFWKRYGFLRGARIDHPRETVRPRYTLAMAHPAVQAHYRELVRNLMTEVPDIGFIHLWTNDSGSGFEFVSSLYAGRNGGPYLIREWKDDREIARKAGANVLTYFHLLRDEGRSVNPDFRLVCDMGPFMSERDVIIPGLGGGIDVGDFGYFEGSASAEQKEALRRTDALTHAKLEVSDNNVLGVPFPSLVHERLRTAHAQGTRTILTGGTPESLAPFDINREVVRAFQLMPELSLSQVLKNVADRWIGSERAPDLVEIWGLSDSAVRGFPQGVPMSTFGFPWFRLWIRPFVPDIDAIPEPERAYYEQFLLATFNNPARIDLNNDMMWNFLTVREAGDKKRQIDENVLRPFTQAIDRCRQMLRNAALAQPEAAVVRDLLDRLRAGRCFAATMRNTMAWTESVHGYRQATTPDEKAGFRRLCREMVDHETQNTRELLSLWEESRVDFMPVSAHGESLHIYGENFGDHLQRKIELMVRHRDDEPNVDPDYMWRMPAAANAEGTPAVNMR